MCPCTKKYETEFSDTEHNVRERSCFEQQFRTLERGTPPNLIFHPGARWDRDLAHFQSPKKRPWCNTRDVLNCNMGDLWCCSTRDLLCCGTRRFVFCNRGDAFCCNTRDLCCSTQEIPCVATQGIPGVTLQEIFLSEHKSLRTAITF